MNLHRLCFSPLLSVCLSLVCLSANATSIVRLASDDLVSRAELIFQGEVVHLQSRKTPEGMIYTSVEFLVQEVLKGPDPGPGLRLRFNGGTVGDVTLSNGVPVPALGEQGIYFVRSVGRAMGNPLVGWSQGHFTVTERNEVRAGNGAPVTAIEARSSDGSLRLSSGVADGFQAIPQGPQSNLPARALTPEEFKFRIRELWDLRRDNEQIQSGSGAITAGGAPPAPHGIVAPGKDPALWARESP